MLLYAFFLFAVVSAVHGLDLDNTASRLGHDGCQDLSAAFIKYDNDDSHAQASSDKVSDDKQCVSSVLELTDASEEDDVRWLVRDVEDHQKYLKRRLLEALDDQPEEYDEDYHQEVELESNKGSDLEDLDDQPKEYDEEYPREFELTHREERDLEDLDDHPEEYDEDYPQEFELTYSEERDLEDLYDEPEEYDEVYPQEVELKHNKKRDLEDLDDQPEEYDEDYPQEVELETNKEIDLGDLDDQPEEYDEEYHQEVELKHNKKRNLLNLDDQPEEYDEEYHQEVKQERDKRSYIDDCYYDQSDFEEDDPQYVNEYVSGHKRSLGGERDWFVVTSTGFILIIFVSLAINSTLLLALGGNISLCFMSGKKPKPIEMNCMISEYDSKSNQVLGKLDIRAEVPCDANLAEAMEKQLDWLRSVNPGTSLET